MSPAPKSFTHYRACNLCEAICGLEIQVEDGAITSIRGDADDPFSRGHVCPKALALKRCTLARAGRNVAAHNRGAPSLGVTLVSAMLLGVRLKSLVDQRR